MASDKRIPIDGFAWRPNDLLVRLRSPELPIDEFWRCMSYALYVMKDDEEFLASLNEVKKERTNFAFPQQEATTPQNEPPAAPQALNAPRKRGRPKLQFEYFVHTDAPEGLMPVLEDMMKGKSGRDAFAVILAITDVYIDEPTNRSVCDRFETVTETPYGEAKARHYGTAYGSKDFSNRANPIEEEELEVIRETIKRKMEEREKYQKSRIK